MGSGGGSKIHAPAPSAPRPTPSDAGQDAVKAADDEVKKLKKSFFGSKTILSGAGLSGNAAVDALKTKVLG